MSEDEEDVVPELIFAAKKKKTVKSEKQEPEEKKEDEAWQPYSYIELLQRIPRQAEADNSQKKRSLPHVAVAKIGSKKTMFANFKIICQLLHRAPEHVQSFFLAEFACDGALDAQGRLVFKRRCLPAEMETLLRKYIAVYVACPSCKHPDTTLSRDSVTRLMFLECSTCHSRVSVAPIQKGFHAVMKSDRIKERK